MALIEFNNTYDFDERGSWTPVPKKQIILCNTNCNLEHHLMKLKYRYNGKYNKIPHFTVSQSGEIFQHLSCDTHSNFFGYEEVDQQAIVITLENHGWLTHNLKMNQFYDWKGNEYDGDFVERNWRGKRFWATYKTEQLESLSVLLNYLCKEHSIEKEFTGNNVTMAKARTFNGILCRSNYNKYYYDLSPAMDFDYIKNSLI